MKNELGIEIKCENCWLRLDCDDTLCKVCQKNGRKTLFKESTKAFKSRIKELQKQQFTKKELEALKGSIEIAKNDFSKEIWEETIFNKILKKIERILNNEQ